MIPAAAILDGIHKFPSITLVRAMSTGAVLFTSDNPFAPSWMRAIGSATETSPENTRKSSEAATQTRQRGKESTLRAKQQRLQRRCASRSGADGAALGDHEPPIRRLFADEEERLDGDVPCGTGSPCSETSGTSHMEEARCAAAGRVQVAARRRRARKLLCAMQRELQVSAAAMIQAAGRSLLARARRTRAGTGCELQELSPLVWAAQAEERAPAECLTTQQLADSPTAVRDPRRRRGRGEKQLGTQEPRTRWGTDLLAKWQEAVVLTVACVGAEGTGVDECTGAVQDAGAPAAAEEPSWLREAEEALQLLMDGEGESHSDSSAPPLAPSGPEASAAAPRRSGGRQRRQRRIQQQQQRRGRERQAAQEREGAVRLMVERELEEYASQLVAAGEEAQRIAQVLLAHLDHLEPSLDRSEGWGGGDGDASPGKVGYNIEMRVAELEAIACIAKEVDEHMPPECAAFEARCVAAGILTGQREARAARLDRLEAFLSQARSFGDELLAVRRRVETVDTVLAHGPEYAAE